MHFPASAVRLLAARGLPAEDCFHMTWLSVLDRAVGSFLYPEEVCLPLVPCLLDSCDLTQDVCLSVGFKRPTAENNVPVRVFCTV